MSQLFVQNKNLPESNYPASINASVLAMLAMGVAVLGMFVHYTTQQSSSQIHLAERPEHVNPSVLALKNAQDAAARH
jgi:hypothetical protein